MSDDAPLDYTRIRRLAVLRRSQHRSALFMLGFAALCIVMACAALVESVSQFRHHRFLTGIGLIIIVAPLLWLMRMCWKRRQRILLELSSKTNGFPLYPPDFTTLQDGSQVARSLNDMVD